MMPYHACNFVCLEDPRTFRTIPSTTFVHARVVHHALHNTLDLHMLPPCCAHPRQTSLVAGCILDSNPPGASSAYPAGDRASTSSPSSSSVPQEMTGGGVEHAEDLRRNIDDCLSVLGKLCVGLDVNPRFSGARERAVINIPHASVVRTTVRTLKQLVDLLSITPQTSSAAACTIYLL